MGPGYLPDTRMAADFWRQRRPSINSRRTRRRRYKYPRRLWVGVRILYYAVFVGLSFRYDKWIADFSGVWAGLSAERTLPRVAISTQIAFGDLLAGRQIYRHVSLTGGVRRMGLRISAQVENSGERTWRPGFWDPLIGLDWRNRLSRKWTAQVSVDGGGFGVGSEVDFSARAHADWRFARHFGVLMGYGILHFQDSDTVLGRTYKTRQALNGPIFGFGIYL